MNIKKITLLTILATILLLCSLSTISAANQTINSTSTGGIAQGITDTGDKDTLFLQPGTYNKTNQDINITISKNITIQGNGSTDSVIIDAQKLSKIFTINNNLNVTFINVTFMNGSFNGGGAINGASGANLSFIGCTFFNNYGSSMGGAIGGTPSSISIVDSIFTNNSANTGGAIRITSAANISIVNSTFTNNTAISGSAGAVSVQSNGFICTIVDSIFDNNNCNLSGTVYVNGNGELSITNSIFTNNRAITSAGGAVYGAGGVNTSVIDSMFVNNSAGANGGALAISANNNLSVVNSTFNDNVANGEAGAIAIGIGNHSIINSTFSNNTATTNGGAIRNSGGNATVANNIFISNNGNMGGAVYNNGVMSVSGNTMSGNSAGLGQMIYNAGTMGVLNLTFIDNSTWVVKNGSTITLYATLVDDMGNTVTGQNISFYLNGIFFENVTAIEGKANITYTPSSISDIPVSGIYAGNGPYNILINNGLLQVRILTNITISVPKEVKVGDKVTLESKLTDEDGNHIVGATVDFYVDGKKIGSAITDSDGIARLNHTFDKAGNPKVTAQFAGNETYGPSNATNQIITVSKIKTNMTITVPKSVKVGENTTIVSKLTDENGNPIANATVDFYVDGKKVGSAVTDANGIAKLNYTFTKAGNYNIQAKFAGNDTYLPSSAATQTKVSKIPTKMTIKKDGDKVIVTLTDEDGNPLEGKKITLRDSKGRVLGFGITNKDGQVIFTYTGNSVYLKASFDGDDMFQGVDAKIRLDNDNDQTNDNSIATNAAMKDTGMPIIAVILVLLASLGFIGIRKE